MESELNGKSFSLYSCDQYDCTQPRKCFGCFCRARRFDVRRPPRFAARRLGEIDRVRKANRKAASDAKRTSSSQSGKKSKSKRARTEVVEVTEVQPKAGKSKSRSRKSAALNGLVTH